MIQSLHLALTLDKEIKRLRKAGGQAELAATRCHTILADIKKHKYRCDAVVSKRTKRGEQRIKNCIKYDLGGGYRLVTVLVGNHLFIPFLGSHDETDQWFQRHRYDIFEPDDSLYLKEKLTPETEQDEAALIDHEAQEDEADPYEQQLQEKLDDSLLKSVFQGLFRNSALSTD